LKTKNYSRTAKREIAIICRKTIFNLMLMTSVLCRAHFSVLHSINIENVHCYRADALLLYVLNGNLINKRHIFMSTLSKSPLFTTHTRRCHIVIWFNLSIVNHRFLRCSFFNFFSLITRSLSMSFLWMKKVHTHDRKAIN
jgi:hypothetical protein